MGKIDRNIVFFITTFYLLTLSSATKNLSRTIVARGDKKSCVCGVSRQARVTEGDRANPGEFPWMVRLYIKKNPESDTYTHRCGGSLITRQHFLTAAHCLVDFYVIEPKSLVAQTVDGKNYSIESFYPHESYDDKFMNNDIAIVKLSSPVSLHAALKTICLPQKQFYYYDNQWGIVIGYGHTDFEELSEHLMKAYVKLISDQRCVEETFWELDRITDNMFCAINGRKDACNGDSGGPLQVRDYRGAMELVGIVSKGRGNRCGDENFPGVYTKVPRYLNWIHSHIENEVLCQPPDEYSH